MKHSKVIRITDYLTIKEHWTAEDIYKTIKYMRLNPRYEQETDLHFARVTFVYKGNPYTISFEHNGKDSKYRRISVEKKGDMWTPSTYLIIHKRHWWY